MNTKVGEFRSNSIKKVKWCVIFLFRRKWLVSCLVRFYGGWLAVRALECESRRFVKGNPQVRARVDKWIR